MAAGTSSDHSKQIAKQDADLLNTAQVIALFALFARQGKGSS